MVAANEASKEEHVVDGVKVDLDDNAVQVAILESFTILHNNLIVHHLAQRSGRDP
jgi:hypothetical protein